MDIMVTSSTRGMEGGPGDGHHGLVLDTTESMHKM